MKILNYLTILSFTFPVLALAAPQANNQSVARLIQYEKTGALEQAIAIGVNEVTRLHHELNLNGVDQEVTSRIHQIDQEVKVQTRSQSLSASLLGFLFRGKANASKDVTKILNTNASQVLGENRKAQADYANLQRNLAQFFTKNESGLYEAKVLTAKVLQLTAALPDTRRKAFVSMAERLRLQMSALTVSGVQHIEFCRTTNYIEHNVGSYTSDISSIFGSLFYNESTTDYAYSDTRCSTEQRVLVSHEAQALSARLALADAFIDYYAENLARKIFVDATAPAYPTWGSPHYNP